MRSGLFLILMFLLSVPGAVFAQGPFEKGGAYDIPGSPDAPAPPEPPEELMPDGIKGMEESMDDEAFNEAVNALDTELETMEEPPIEEPAPEEGVYQEVDEGEEESFELDAAEEPILGEAMLDEPFPEGIDFNSLPEQHIVEPGDTLWDLSARYLNNPWYWQSIWAMNQQITNPHWIYPGDVLNFRPQMPGEPMRMEIALGEQNLGDIREAYDPGQAGSVAGGLIDLPSMEKINFFNFRRDGFVARSELRNTGTIAGSRDEGKISFAEGDRIYIKPQNSGDYTIGQYYQIFRSHGEVDHPVSEETIGYKVEILGQIEVEKVINDVVIGHITQSYNSILRGDLVRPWLDAYRDLRPKRNMVEFKNGYIVDFLDENILIGQMQILFIDKGISHGLKEGNRLFVVRRGDGLEQYEILKKDQYPYEKIAELLVLSAGSSASTAVVTHSITNLERGDRVIMEKNY